MSNQDTAARNSNVEPDAPDPAAAEGGELDEELSRFANRLAGFGLGEALDALMARRDLKDAQARPDPEPC